ncbi:hypothetical protein [Bacillus sp. T33-2]|uniref:hypothetical protein n=1 Tax=Bacillus sp. T33-2 TaxID=2054168 RepID=UPI000C7724A4|nr:hypothetical protein [Bacillus sp. T33-2]PLR91129.1 preprotein translocase subunit Tim44 [Bacillus sp. T33-2]
MYKKIIAAIVAIAVAFSPAGNIVFQDHDHIASAKRYSSGAKKYRGGNNYDYNNRQNNTVRKTAPSESTAKKNIQNRRGFMGGLMYGGLAGLLLGGLFASMGPLGPMLGFAINILGIFLLFAIIRRLFFRNRYNRDRQQW